MDTSTWTDPKLAGQRLMAGFDGTRLNEGLQRLIAGLRVGGLILFKRNVESPSQLSELTQSAQKLARDCGQPPLFIAIDQEGGRVARLGPPFTQFPGTPPVTNAAEAARFAEITAAELAAAGINMDLAPVLDVAPAGFGSVMAERAFGSDPERVARLGAIVIEGLQSRRIMAVAKHFPGIGRTTLDSHLDLPVLDADLPSFEAFDLIPFRAAIAKQVAGVMLSHIRYTGMDPLWPASLSQAIAKDLLRERMGYSGLVMTDDLDMGAIKNHYDVPTIIRRILTADVDLALICHKGPNIASAFDEIQRQLADDADLKKHHEQSLSRIMHWKNKLFGRPPWLTNPPASLFPP